MVKKLPGSRQHFSFLGRFNLDRKLNPQTYILRVYRFSRDNPHRFVGVVEEIGRKGKKAFTGYQELWEILNSPQRFPSMKKSRPRLANIAAQRDKRDPERRNT